MNKLSETQLLQQLEEMPLNEVPIVVLDTETTGLFPALGERIIEVGAIRYENWQPVGTFSQLINPQCPVSAKSTELTGLKTADLADKPIFASIKDDLLDFVDGALMVAHNAVFDATFLNHELFIANLPHSLDSENNTRLPNPWLCTLKFARSYFHFGRNNLAAVAQQLNVRIGTTHRAMQDVYLTAEVCRRMTNDLTKQRGWLKTGDFLHAQGGAVYPNIISSRAYLPAEIEAGMKNGRSLTITYLDKDNKETQRTITPLYPTTNRNTDYIIAHCHLRKTQRTFRLDRILSAT